MPDHIVYTDEGEPVPFTVRPDHVLTWGRDNEAAILDDESLGIDPEEWARITEQEGPEADLFFGGSDEE